MKNSQKGFVMPVLLVIIALLVIGGGIYIYKSKKTEVPTVVDIGTQQTNPASTKISVAGMSQYTDSSFGFSFWYPSGWSIEQEPDTNFSTAYAGGIVKKRWTLHSTIDSDHTMKIEEYYSPSASITLNAESGCPGGICSTTYRFYFNATTHTWMYEVPLGSLSERGDGYAIAPGTKISADVSHNTMGGLHVFSGGLRGEAKIIPLSAHNFVIVTDQPWNVGPSFKSFLVDTIVATDPSVATPVNATQQQITIQAEKDAYQQEADKIKASRAFQITSVASAGLPNGQIYSGEKFIASGPQIHGCETVRSQSCDVEVSVGGKMGTFVSDPNQLTFVAPQLTPGVYNLYISYPTTGATSQTVQIKVLSR